MLRIDGMPELPPPPPPKPPAAAVTTASYDATASPPMRADSVTTSANGGNFWSGIVSWVQHEVSTLAAKIPPPVGGAAPASQYGVPPQGTESGYNAPTTYPVMRAAPAGTLFSSSSTDSQAATIFQDLTGGGEENPGIDLFISGRATGSPYLSSGDSKYYSSLTQEQRVQIAMQQLGPEGVTRYLASLQQQIDMGGNGGGLNVVEDSPRAFSDFQTGFNALVKDGAISSDDVRALAAEPAFLISQGYLTSPLGVMGDLSGNAKLFAGLDPYDARSLSTMNLFTGASYDTADALLKQNVPHANDMANLLYASGSHVLGATGYDNESGFVAQMSTGRLHTILDRSMNGEVYVNGENQRNPVGTKEATPLTGSAQLLDTIASEGYDDNGRLGSSSKGQQDILMAYNLTQSMLSGSDKTGQATFQTLLDADQNGSGVRLALGNIIDAGMPAILNDAWAHGGNANVSTSFGHFSEFQMAGNYNSKGEGQLIGQLTGNAYAEFYSDVVNAASSTAGTDALIKKYGPQMFQAAPGTQLDIPVRQNEVGNGFSLFGSMMHGTNQGLNDLAARTSKNDSVDGTAISAFGGALATVAGSAILVFAPEGALLLAANALIAGGAAGTLVSTFDGVSGHSTKPPATLGWSSEPTGQAEGNTPFSQLQDQLGLAAGSYSSADKSAYEGSLFGGF